MEVRVNGINLTYDERGTGPALLLIHGFPLCRKMWQPQLEALADAGFRVIAPDLRGFGESEAGDSDYSMDLLADDLVGLMDSLGIELATVAGMSMGGYLLLNLLERYPQRVAAALFVVTRSGADDEAGKARRTEMARLVQSGQAQAVPEAFAGVLFAEETSSTRPELVAEVGAWMSATGPKALAGGLLAMRDRRDCTDLLPHIRIPALVIGGEKDRAIPPEHSRSLAAAIAEAECHILADAGHMANLEQPEAFNACVLEFLRKNR